MSFLTTELHCHNVFSNFNVSNFDTPYDCNITIDKQLEQSFKIGLDVLFITNHNTLKGYKELIDYKINHKKYEHIKIYPAEEITTSTGEHILAYGITKTIKPGLSFDEIIDEIKKQNAISSAPHPFSLTDALREKSQYCDMIEVFNSNNVDIFSNIKAYLFALDKKLPYVSGSDSHVVTTIGRCLNTIESENNLDDILFAMQHNKIKIKKYDYVNENEILEHIQYKIYNSEDYIIKYIKANYPAFKSILSLLLKVYNMNPNSYAWKLFYKFTVIMLKKTSLQINLDKYAYSKTKNQNLKISIDNKFRLFNNF